MVEQRIEDSAADRAPNPEAQLVRRKSQHRRRAIVRALPRQDRQCLALRAEGLRYREIVVEILNLSLGGVSLSLARSVVRIGRAI